jgi:transcriptional antiterminator RfaH
MEAWYALYTKPNAEAQVARNLLARGFTTFLPLLPTRPGERLQPLFPTYLFLRCDMETVGMADLFWIPGLRRIVSFNGRPAVVPDEAIELIRQRLAQIKAQGGLPCHHFKPGDKVVIEEGPLAGLEGIFQGPMGPAERVQVLIHFLGQVNRLDIPVSMLRAAPPEEFRARRRGTRGHGRHIHYHDTPVAPPPAHAPGMELPPQP